MRTGRNAAVFLVLLWLLLAPAALSYAQEIPPSPYWKNEIVFPDEPFRASGTFASDPGWVKFTILLDPYDRNIVYFQDSKRYVFHYNFAVELLTPFIGMTPGQFDEATLYEEDQQAVMGAVIMPPNTGWPELFPYPEYGIQFVRHDPYTKEEVAGLFNIVKSRVQADPGVQAFYFPAYEQIGAAEANREWFESQGIPIGSASRWAPGNACYSSGWALGKLKYFDGDNIQDAYLAGLLEPNDILLTDGVPAEVPFVAGIISLSPSTPNSHVAILAKTFGVPFVHLALAEDAERAWELVGRRIVLRAFEGWYEMDIRLIDVQGVLDEQAIDEILALKEPPALEISAMAAYGAYSASTNGLLPSDTKYFGGKAANFGILRAVIPDNCPVAAAFSFRLWKEFLGQELITHKTLREEINSRLADYTYPPSDMAALADDLSYIRDMFRDKYFTRFTHSQENAVISILQDPRYGFDANRNIRFRSSTNVEDCNYFTGAGLYDSNSGCLADDLDGNESGPCICDANETGERGVFRAIRKVFASFYNDNAFLERLRYGVNEADVGMALLVHHSTPDEFELANGVATAEKSYGSNWEIKLVTQLGAVSVANPQDGSIPEEVSVTYKSASDIDAQLVRSSNLVILGDTVMDWRDDYTELSRLLVLAAEQFRTVTGKTQYTLDFEYKKVAPEGKLIVKQVREIPQPDNTRSVTPFLINEPVEYCTFQGEYGDVFANHRLKSRWRFETKNMWLTKQYLAQCLYTNVELEYMDSERVRSVCGKLSEWPFASHRTQQGGYEHQVDTIDEWLMHHLQNRRLCKFRTEWIPTLVSRAENPMLTLEDFQWLALHVEYDEPVVTIDGTGPTTTTTESIRLCPCPQPQQGDIFQQRVFPGPNDVWLGPGDINITTRFYWPPAPAGPIAGYTAPLVRWVETVIEGLTSEPIVLHDWYSQTYHPWHHNFDEDFIFEPGLEPGLSADLLEELREKDIRFLCIYPNPDPNSPYDSYVIEPYGFDDKAFLAADLDDDKDVDLRDLALFGAHWGNRLCSECGGADLTGDGCVLACDLWELGESWLATIE